ncbi:acetate--CoA ligase family protein [Ochrobactrum sp. XJ1]|nr:acetate--CoA ligase family protein [Ochrobactrum sp. XJ1]
MGISVTRDLGNAKDDLACLKQSVSEHPLHRFFTPQSIAIIGASSNPEKLGHAAVKAILSGGYEGLVIPVNPTASEICGLPCISDASLLPDGIDLAIVLLPADQVLETVEKLSARGIKGVVIPAGGFAETGEEGALIEQKITEIARRAGMRILGPNVPGFTNNRARLNATFVSGQVASGNLAILSQAGSIAYMIQRNARQDGLEFGRFICFGNQVDLCAEDLLDYLSSDDDIGAICMYLESVVDGRRFVEIASRVTKSKPIVAIKGGRTAAGHGAIFSHTASISSPEMIYRAAFRRAGIVWADDMRSVGLLAMALSGQGGAKGPRVAIVTSLAGVGVVAADACEDQGLNVAEPSAALRARLATIVPAKGSTTNPVDLTGDVSPAMLAAVIRMIAESGEFDCVLPLVMGVPNSEAFGDLAYADACLEALREARAQGMGCAVHWVFDETGGSQIATVRERLATLSIPVTTYPEEAVSLLRGLVEHGRIKVGAQEAAPACRRPEALSEAIAARKDVLTEHDSKMLLAQASIPVVPSILVRSGAEAVTAAEKIGYPVVLKLQSADATHKSDIGGVALNIEDAAQVLAAFEHMNASFSRHVPDGVMDGVSVQPMVKDAGIELICGVSEDPQFGKYLMLGVGGTAVELLKDVSLRLLPVGKTELREMLDELKCAPLLHGYRGKPAVDMDALVDTLSRIAAFGDMPEIVEVELNPLLATGKNARALDARIKLRL